MPAARYVFQTRYVPVEGCGVSDGFCRYCVGDGVYNVPKMQERTLPVGKIKKAPLRKLFIHRYDIVIIVQCDGAFWGNAEDFMREGACRMDNFIHINAPF